MRAQDAPRPARLADAPAVSALLGPLFERHIAPTFPEERGRALFRAFVEAEAVATRLSAGAVAFLIEDASGAAAYGERDGAHIRLLFVRDDRQGQGLSRRLLAALIEGVDATAVTLNASDYARPRYRRLGFVETGPRGIEAGVVQTPMRLSIS
ncbi:MAG: GNAT family N-acetyltransferase [Alphaproteobacteria bacterium]|nr:GNAT family N-acetyltransferase [Alphaproteobacteria bacterium]